MWPHKTHPNELIVWTTDCVIYVLDNICLIKFISFIMQSVK